MRTLDVKLLRDLWRLRGQGLAIAMVLAAACATFIMSLGVHRSITETRDAYYARNHFADVFASMNRAPRSVIRRVADIRGVRVAEGTIQQYATLDFPDRVTPVRALLNSVEEDGGNRLNQLTLQQGRLPRSGHPGEVVADEAFVKANGLAIGSAVNALVYGRRLTLRIVGIGLAPNFIYAIAPGDIIPDDTRFGVFWIGRKTLEAATDRTEAINTLALTLERGASVPDTIRAIDTLLGPYGGAGAYDRADHLSNAFLDNELMQLQAMTRVIPPVFLLVAVFLVYMVLGRQIRTERAQIGLLKAFGYSDWAVGGHYLKMALAIALIATALGAGLGIWMGGAVTRIYAQYYRFPFLDYRISLPVILAAGALSFAAAALGAIGGMRSAVHLPPAVAMSPPPPPVYRSGMVERLGQSAGFSVIGHMIVRHIARWPLRSAVTVLGVALSGGLLFSTLQFFDSSRTMLDSYFIRAQRQDLTVSFTEPRNAAALFALARIPGVMRVEPLRGVAVKMTKGNRSQRTVIESTRNDAQLSLRIDSSGRVIALPSTGLMLSRQLADKLAVRVGERVHIELLGGRRTQLDLPVVSIVTEFIGERAYAAEPTLEAISRDAAPVGAALLRIDPAARAAILSSLKTMPWILGVTEKTAALRKFEQMIDDNMLTMIAFYIAFASAIAVGVIYNSARILYSERAHELATLRVLGYFRSEVGLVMLGELALLVVISVPFGCAIGYGMAHLMTTMFSSDLFRLPFAPSRASYGWATVIVMAAAMATAAIVARRVLRLDMVRVLKGRD
ncbi:MAG: hypothetical protein RLZZ84_1522 [Pseudomonadota bacterium]